MPSYLPATGKTGTVTINNIAFCPDTWRWAGRNNEANVSSFCGGQYEEFVSLKSEQLLMISGTWDLGRNLNSLGFKLGATVQNVILTVSGIIRAVTPTAYIKEFEVTDNARGTVRYMMVIRGDWQFGDFSNSLA